MIELCGNKYELVDDIKEAFKEEDVKEKFLPLFSKYDYVCGDWSDSKLRLKGFYEKLPEKKMHKQMHVNFYDMYIKRHCAAQCPHFLLKKSK